MRFKKNPSILVFATYENPEETMEFSRNARVNRYIKLCNPLLRIGNSFSWIVTEFICIRNSFSRIATREKEFCKSKERLAIRKRTV